MIPLVLTNLQILGSTAGREVHVYTCPLQDLENILDIMEWPTTHLIALAEGHQQEGGASMAAAKTESCILRCVLYHRHGTPLQSPN